jgi:DNA (cytosine-5)-methyltransferase 1
MICNRDDKSRNEREKNVDTDKIYTLHLFAGAGGGILGDLLLGHIPVGAVEIEAYPRKVLLARQLDGSIPRFPIWDDVCTFRADNTDTSSYIERLRGIRDRLCICGGFPCQDISFAGKRVGIAGEKSGLWKEYYRILQEVQPRFVFAENSARLVTSGLDVVLQDLASLGYDASWVCISASSVGAPHLRERCFIMAYPSKSGRERDGWRGWVERRLCRVQKADRASRTEASPWHGVWPTEPSVERVLPSGVANALDRHYAIGNGQVPRVVKLAWELLMPNARNQGLAPQGEHHA